MIRLLIIDGLNVVRRIYSALPAKENDAPDIPTFLSASDKAFKHILAQHHPSHAVCVFEHYTSTWRHRLYPPYKAHRKPQPPAMLATFPRLRKILDQYEISWLDIEGYEADDIIASIVHTTHEHDCQNLILSTDHLMAQLLDDKTYLYDHFSQQAIDRELILKRHGVTPQQLCDFYALVGSHSVNVPGIAGIGVKTAASLLAEYDDCDTLLEARDRLPTRTGNQLKGAEPAVYLYRALFTLRQDCPIHANLKDWRIPEVITP